MSPLSTVLAMSSVTTPVLSSMPMTIMNSTVPMTLKRMCAMPVRLASLEVPREQRKAVTMQVPILMPMMSGYTSWKVIAPVTESACSIPTTAELLWTMTVTAMPTMISSTGISENCVSRFTKVSDSARGATALVMVIMPVNSTPKPTHISPGPLTLLRFTNMTSMMPIMSAAGARVEGLNISSTTFPPDSISMSLMICAVIVVPILAPITMLIA